MKKTVTRLLMAAGVLAFTACAPMTTERQGISDKRPQISFKADSERVLNAKVIVDGRDMGQVGSYLAGADSLRVHPGTHMLLVAAQNRLIYQQTFYAGDGGHHVFTVN
jgi:hypothetical protein